MKNFMSFTENEVVFHENVLTKNLKIKNIGLSGVACAHATLYVHPMETAMVQGRSLPYVYL